MSNSSFRDGIQFAWDSTSLKAANTCPRYYYYSMIEGITPRETSVHLVFGAIYAKALESFYKYKVLDGMDYESALEQVVRDALVLSWDEEASRPIEFAHNAKSRLGLIRSIVWYLDQFVKDEEEGSIQTHILRNGKPAVEVSFTLNITDDLTFCGHLDRIVNYADALYVMDQKTTGSALSSYFFNQFKPDDQMSMYSFAGKIVAETPVKGVIIDAAQILVGSTTFARGFTHRTEAELDEWFNSALDTIRRTQHYTQVALESDKPEQAFPMNATACGNYGGCPFRPICSASPSIRRNIIKTDYRQKVWDPLERR